MKYDVFIWSVLLVITSLIYINWRRVFKELDSMATLMIKLKSEELVKEFNLHSARKLVIDREAGDGVD